MTYRLATPQIGAQSLTETSTVQQHKLGTIVKGVDDTLGEGEFIYLLGVASTIVGSMVTWHPSTHQTALSAIGTYLPHTVAFAMSANLAAGYGWYQIGGLTTAAKNVAVSLAAGVAIGQTSAGLVAKSGSGDEIQGAIVAAVASAMSVRTTVLLMINRPHKMGRIT
jgi:hypothetical protein